MSTERSAKGKQEDKEFEYGGTRLVDLDSGDKKIILSILANYFMDGIPTSEDFGP